MKTSSCFYWYKQGTDSSNSTGWSWQDKKSKLSTLLCTTVHLHYWMVVTMEIDTFCSQARNSQAMRNKATECHLIVHGQAHLPVLGCYTVNLKLSIFQLIQKIWVRGSITFANGNQYDPSFLYLQMYPGSREDICDSPWVHSNALQLWEPNSCWHTFWHSRIHNFWKSSNFYAITFYEMAKKIITQAHIIDGVLYFIDQENNLSILFLAVTKSTDRRELQWGHFQEKSFISP